MGRTDVFIVGFFILLAPLIVRGDPDYLFAVSDGKATVVGYNGAGGDITIPDEYKEIPVTAIGPQAFRDQTALTSVIIQEGVTVIGQEGFRGCSNLTRVDLPDSLLTVEGAAFFDCSTLQDVDLPDGLTSLGNSVFWGCSSLSSLILPDGITVVGAGLLREAAALRSITFSEGTTAIHAGAFYGCSALREVHLPESLQVMGHSVFKNCTSLTEVILPDDIASIESSTFSNCTALIRVVIPNSVTSIGASAFRLCTSLVDVTLPDSLTSIADNLFNGCFLLADIVIPGRVTDIGISAFHDCASLTEVILPESVISIGNNAFRGCSQLAHIAIPASVTSLGLTPFIQCASLSSLDVAAANPKFSGIDGVLFNKAGTSLIRYPQAREGFYLLPAGVAFIEDWAFSGSTHLTEVTMGYGLLQIGMGAFENCTNLQKVFFRGNAPVAEDLAFDGTAATLYRRHGATGWTNPFASRPALIWPEFAFFLHQEDGFRFDVYASAGQTLRLQWCMDLAETSWTTFATVTVPEGDVADFILDLDSETHPKFFLRAVSP
jgi:hypothetical protein